jgi:hypothetical protein
VRSCYIANSSNGVYITLYRKKNQVVGFPQGYVTNTSSTYAILYRVFMALSRSTLRIVIIFAFSCIGAFLCGRWYGMLIERQSEAEQEILPVVNNAILPNEHRANMLNDEVFASSRGSKYYYSWCTGYASMKAEYRVRFATVKEAESAGYTLSKSCKL